MKVHKAQYVGFCYGVQRATQIAFGLISKGKYPIFTIGPLMHNPQEVARLSKYGIIPKQCIEDCKNSITLVRTHGISRQDHELARRIGLNLVDTTCPHVKFARKRIQAFSHEQRTVLMVGDRNHPEVHAQLSYASTPAYVIDNKDELSDMGINSSTRIGVLAQTTLSTKVFSQVVDKIKVQCPDTVVANTICEDTQQRQHESKCLAEQVDSMVIVGGRNSANTKRLVELCTAIEPRTYHVETAEELRGFLFHGICRVGLVSGASTPDWIIKQVEKWLCEH